MAIEPIKGFYVHDEETNTDGIAKYSASGLAEPISQTSNVSETVLQSNLYNSIRRTATGSLAVTLEDYSGSHLSGTIPYQSNVLLTNWKLNLTPGKYTLYVKSKTGFAYPDKLDINIYNVSGVTYPLNRKEPLVFSVGQEVNNSALRFYLYNSSYSSGLQVDDTLYIYLCAGEHTVDEFDRYGNLEMEIVSVVEPLAMHFKYGTIDGNNGEITDFYKYSRAYSDIVTFPFPVTISTPDGYYLVLYYDENGMYKYCQSAWHTSDASVIEKNQPFRVMLAKDNSANMSAELGTLVSLLKIMPFTRGLPIPFERGSLKRGVDDTYNQNARARSPICVHDFDLKISTKIGAFSIDFMNDDDTFSFGVGEWNYNSYIIPAGQKYRIVITNDPNSAASVPVETLIKGFTFSRVENRYKKALDYIRPLKWHFNTDPQTQGTWPNHNHGNLFTIAHISDVHADAIRYRNFCNFVNDNEKVLDAAIQTGDLIDAPTSEQIDAMHGIDPNNIILWCTGNHDIAGNAGDGNMVSISRSELYNAFELDTNTGELYYYKDFVSKGVRLIVLNTYNADNSSIDYDYKSSQLEWFVSALKDAASNSLSVIVAMHYQESDIVENDKGFYTRFYQWGGVGGGTPFPYSAVEDIIDAFKNGTTVTTAFYNGTITADFSGYDGDFVCYITGHRHQDRIGYSKKHTDQLIINIVCGALNEGFGRKIRNFTDVSDLPRVQGEDSENAFNVYAFDLENRFVKVLRVGADMNDQMKPRLIETYTF